MAATKMELAKRPALTERVGEQPMDVREPCPTVVEVVLKGRDARLEGYDPYNNLAAVTSVEPE